MHSYSELTPSSSGSRNLARRLFGAGFALTIVAPLAMAGGASAQSFLQLGKDADRRPATAETCTGTVKQVLDATNEAVLFTSAQFGTTPGGGQGKQTLPAVHGVRSFNRRQKCAIFRSNSGSSGECRLILSVG